MGGQDCRKAFATGPVVQKPYEIEELSAALTTALNE